MIEKLKDLGDRAKITIGMEKSRPLMSQDAKCCSIIILSCSFFSLSSLFTGQIHVTVAPNELYFMIRLQNYHSQFTIINSTSIIHK